MAEKLRQFAIETAIGVAGGFAGASVYENRGKIISGAKKAGETIIQAAKPQIEGLKDKLQGIGINHTIDENPTDNNPTIYDSPLQE